MTNDNTNEIKRAKREYYREWRKNNPDRVAQIQERYWLKKAAELRSQAAGNQVAADGSQGRDAHE